VGLNPPVGFSYLRDQLPLVKIVVAPGKSISGNAVLLGADVHHFYELRLMAVEVWSLFEYTLLAFGDTKQSAFAQVRHFESNLPCMMRWASESSKGKPCPTLFSQTLNIGQELDTDNTIR
jgi:hypothetical protein